MDFAEKVRGLERKFVAAVAVDGSVYLPNFTPVGPVDAILIGMEPSLGWWAQPPSQAAMRVAAGFRNFMWSLEDFILHYAARRFFCPPGKRYHLTDVSKGAMRVAEAGIDRHARYSRWAPLLEEEVQLVAKPGAHIIAIGKDVRAFLDHRFPGRCITTIMHYSPQAGAARTAAVAGQEGKYRSFAETLSMQDIIEAASAVMRENSVPTALSEETLIRLRKGTLTESRKKLAFIYVTAFAALR